MKNGQNYESRTRWHTQGLVRYFLAWVLLCLLGGFAVSALAQPAPEPVFMALQPGSSGADLAGRVGFLSDPNGTLTIDDVRSAAVQAQLTYPVGPQNKGGDDAAMWFVIQLKQEQTGANWVLTLPTAWLRDVRMYGPFDASGKALAAPIVTGSGHPYSTRPFASELLVMPLDLPEPGLYTVFVRAQSQTTKPFNFQIRSPAAFYEEGLDKRLFDGLCYGIVLAMLIYNLVLLTAFRDRTYAMYVASCAFGLLTIASFNGHTAHYLFDGLPGQGEVGLVVFPLVWLMTSAWFAHGFLDFARYAPRLGRVVLVLSGVAGLGVVLALVGQLMWAQKFLQYLSLVTMVCTFVGALVSWRRGFLPARWYLAGQTALFVFVFIVVFIEWGWVVSPFMDANALQTGLAIEVMVFAVAMSSRIRMMQAQHAEMQVRTQRLTVAAETDPLTGVANRAGLAVQAQALLSQPGDYCLLLLDLDKFKPINDVHGHEAGDVVLVEIARRLGAQLRVGDTVARVGGDEFVILLGQACDRPMLEVISKRLLQVISEPVAYGQVQLAVGGSLGLARFPGNGLTLADLMQAADVAMYHIKKNGRAGFAFFDDLSDLDAQAAAQSVAGAVSKKDDVELF
jgi:diguanylate cyclase (GGDEF)-like protein